MAISDAAILDYLAANANLSDAQIAAEMNKHGVSYAQMANVTGIPVADVERRYLGSNGASTLPQLNTLGNAFASMSSPATLTPEIASNLMQRSMTTGVPTSEFDKYGGYDAVSSLYNSNKGTYSLDDLDPAFLDQMDNIIANTGVGNLSVLKMTGEPLTRAGRQAMIDNGISWTDDDLKAMAIPYEGFLQTPKRAATGSLTGSAGSTAGQLTAGGQAMDTSGGGSSGGNWNARQAVGASDGSLMGAGNADYNSSLIKSLRQSSLTPFSTNTGVLMAPNQGASTSSLVPSMDQMGGAFNPQVLNPRAASGQEVSDWNAYSTYRTNALNAKTPVLSMAEWLAGGKSDGKAPTNPTTPVYDDYSAGA